MKAQDNGGPIAPSMVMRQLVAPDTFAESRMDAVGGLTLRDWFAGLAMQGIVSRQPQPPVINRMVIAGDCYSIADAMIESRKHSDPYEPCVCVVEKIPDGE